MIKENKDLVILTNPKSSFSESIKTIRTNLNFKSIDKELRTILITSPEPGDGKSFLSSNLAVAYSEEGKKVLIIDCDLRRGRQSSIFNIPASKSAGYTNLILNFKSSDTFLEIHEKYICKTNINNLDLLPNGITPPNPVELLNSKNNELILNLFRKAYDIIILDCPPVLGLSDTLIMTKYSDANIVTISSNKTKIDNLIEVKNNFGKVGAAITGIIINKAKEKKNSYYE